MIREFSYTSSSGTKNRKVFVIRETDKYIEGLDLTLLDEDSVKTITNKYKDIVPSNNKETKVVLEDFNPDWNKAYRQFSKSKIDSYNECS